MKLKCIAVDDEPLALGLICTYIDQTPYLELAGRYDNAVEALRGLHETEIDLIFLDIQMPDLTGIELARVLDRGRDLQGPRIIFTTAFSQYALEGYKVDALDYLLKPFSYEEFLGAASKAKAYARLYEQNNNLLGDGAVSSTREPKPEENYLFLKVEYQLVRVAYDDILYIQGLKDYVKVYLLNNPRPLLSLSSLKSLEAKLPARRFMRIHRSFIVSMDRISAIRKNSVQIGDKIIAVSDQYKENFSVFVSRWTN